MCALPKVEIELGGPSSEHSVGWLQLWDLGTRWGSVSVSVAALLSAPPQAGSLLHVSLSLLWPPHTVQIRPQRSQNPLEQSLGLRDWCSCPDDWEEQPCARLSPGRMTWNHKLYTPRGSVNHYPHPQPPPHDSLTHSPFPSPHCQPAPRLIQAVNYTSRGPSPGAQNVQSSGAPTQGPCRLSIHTTWGAPPPHSHTAQHLSCESQPTNHHLHDAYSDLLLF